MINRVVRWILFHPCGTNLASTKFHLWALGMATISGSLSIICGFTAMSVFENPLGVFPVKLLYSVVIHKAFADIMTFDTQSAFVVSAKAMTKERRKRARLFGLIPKPVFSILPPMVLIVFVIWFVTPLLAINYVDRLPIHDPYRAEFDRVLRSSVHPPSLLDEIEAIHKVNDGSISNYAMGASFLILLCAVIAKNFQPADAEFYYDRSLQKLFREYSRGRKESALPPRLQSRRWQAYSVSERALVMAILKAEALSPEPRNGSTPPSSAQFNPQVSAPRIFICHASEDKGMAQNLYERLAHDGQTPWMDTEDLLPGTDWDREIRIAVKSSRFFLACISSHSVTKTGYVQREIRLALNAAEERPEGEIYIIPVLLEPCEIPLRLSRWHSVQLFSPEGYEKLLRVLGQVR
jgi:hypothetical protein